MSFKKWTTAKIDKKKKIEHHLERSKEATYIDEELDASIENLENMIKSDEKFQGKD